MSRPLNPSALARDFRKKFHVSMFDAKQFLSDDTSPNKSLPQPPPPSADEINEVIANHAKKKEQEKQNEEKVNYGRIEIKLAETKSVAKPYFGDRIHNQVFKVFKILGSPGARRFTIRQ